MRTNIEIDDKLMAKAMKASRTTTKKAAVEAALQMLVRIHAQEAILRLRGTIDWEGDLNESRRRRFQDMD
jgi:Arc/MetJ family transcription regulator